MRWASGTTRGRERGRGAKSPSVAPIPGWPPRSTIDFGEQSPEIARNGSSCASRLPPHATPECPKPHTDCKPAQQHTGYRTWTQKGQKMSTKVQRLVNERVKRSGVQNEEMTELCWALKCGAASLFVLRLLTAKFTA